jgi:hypothetical protein
MTRTAELCSAFDITAHHKVSCQLHQAERSSALQVVPTSSLGRMIGYSVWRCVNHAVALFILLSRKAVE